MCAVSERSDGVTSDDGCGGKDAMKWRFRSSSKKSKSMMMGGKGSGGQWKIDEERMENMEVFK